MAVTFFVDAPLLENGGAAAAAAERGEPASPAIAVKPVKEAEGRAAGPSPGRAPGRAPGRRAGGEERAGAAQGRRVVAYEPEDKMLRVTIPGMARVRGATVPYAAGDDEDAFRRHAGVHLAGTGDPWDREANVFIAGHRLGYPNTDSWLAFWDLNNLETGDRIFVTDSNGRRYVYRVFKDFIVDPTDVYVTEPVEGKNLLTLQTCTLPDYSRRLIVRAVRVA